MWPQRAPTAFFENLKNAGAKTISVQIENNPAIFVVARIFGGTWRWQDCAKKNLTTEEVETASEYAREA